MPSDYKNKKSYSGVSSDEYEEKRRERQYTPLLAKEVSTPILRPIEITQKIIKKEGEARQTAKELIKGFESIKISAGEVVGDIFDRVDFLKERIYELQSSLKDRNVLNQNFNGDIDKEIQDKEKLLSALADREQIREVKLDITLLRMEKRRENVQFWKDSVELKKEIQNLHEELRIQSKIANIFSRGDVNGR